MEWSLRIATTADAERVALNVHEGYALYLSFAPDWNPPSLDAELALAVDGLSQPDAWCLLAEAGGELAGHVAIRDSATARFGGAESGLCHFWQLFVKPDWHGSGLGKELHDAALREASERGYAELRLYAVEGAARARRFYEREGWALRGDTLELAGFGLPVVEYRRPISISV